VRRPATAGLTNAGDSASLLWERALAVAGAADAETTERAQACTLLGVAEALVASRQSSWRQAALALATEPGPAQVCGCEAQASTGGAVAANSLLMHANLADDTYLTAEHPGVQVLPVALALADADPTIGGERWLHAVIAGYEVAGCLAAATIPAAPRRGWRVTAAIAPLAAATTATLLLPSPRTTGPQALRLASAFAGGTLAVFGGGDGWRLQPGAGAVVGLLAARAAGAGLDGDPASLDGERGLLATMTGSAAALPVEGAPAILGVTFKRYQVPMYGQAVWAALDGAPLRGPLTSMRIRVPEFATAYAAQDAGAVTSVQGIALSALAQLVPGARPPAADAIEVIGDNSVGEHGAVIETIDGSGTEHRLDGDGDTSGWGRSDAEAQARQLLGDGAEPLIDAARGLVAASSAASALDLRGERR